MTPPLASPPPGWSPLRRGLVAAAVVVLVVTALLGLNRLSWMREISGSDLQYLNSHDVQIDGTTGILRAGGNDPWVELALPPRLTPLSEITLRLQKLAPLGSDFRLYFEPQGRTIAAFDEQCTRQPTITGGGEVVNATWKIGGLTSSVRIDPPDFAQVRIEAVRVRVHPFGGVFWLDFVELAAQVLLVGAVVWTCGGLVESLRAGYARLATGSGLLMGAAVVLRLWLVADRSVECVGFYPHDDLLFLRLARSIVQGDWLGPYNQLTLVKGPLYPLWIAGSFLLGVPLLFGQQLAYVAVCGVVGRALRPVVPDGRLRAAIGLWLLFNPATLAANDTSRILRNFVAALLALAVFGVLAGAVARRTAARGPLARWAAAGGVLLGLLWITREEVVWMAGPLGLLAAFAAWELWRTRPADGGARALVLFGLPLAGWGVVVGGVCALNWHHYGWWGTVEFRAAEFRDAYGALTRVKPARARPRIPVAHALWPRIAEVSPAFRELLPYLEGPSAAHWLAADLAEANPSGLPEVPGGAFMWDLRDAVAEYGHHGSPTQALAFYRRLADEVNAACTAGRVPALDRRSSFLPPWIPEYTAALPRTWFGAWRFVLTLQGFDARPKPSADGPAEIEDVFRDLTRTPTSPHAGAPGLPLQHQWEDGRGRLARGVAGLYGEVLPWLFGGAVLALAGAVALQVIARRVLLSAVLAAAALAGAAAVITVVTLVDLTSFGAVCIGYLASSYPLVLLFVPLSGVALYDAGRTWQQRRASPAGPGSAPMA